MESKKEKEVSSLLMERNTMEILRKIEWKEKVPCSIPMEINTMENLETIIEKDEER